MPVAKVNNLCYHHIIRYFSCIILEIRDGLGPILPIIVYFLTLYFLWLVSHHQQSVYSFYFIIFICRKAVITKQSDVRI